jgi:uncharacterized GH25 family protein
MKNAKKVSNVSKSIFFFTFFIFALPIFAHEFWLQPDKFIYKRGAKINVRFLVGENFEGKNWSGNKQKINTLKLYSTGTIDDLSSQLTIGKGDSLQFNLHDECTAIVTFNSTNSFIQLPSKKFTEYLNEDGLKNAIDYRELHNATDSPGRELYQRSGKTIFQIGNKKDNISIPSDLPLDIIPELNPYNLKNNDPINFTILFNKKILSNQLIKIWHRVNNQTSSFQMVTDKKGRIKIKIATSGKWMVSTVKMSHLEYNDTADWQSFWGSCTWGYE